MSLRRVAGVALLAAAWAGCTHLDVSAASLGSQKEFGVIQMGSGIFYLVDPRTETCLLVYVTTAAVPVSCAKLKRSVPEAARYITWSAEPAEACPAVAPAPAPVPAIAPRPAPCPTPEAMKPVNWGR